MTTYQISGKLDQPVTDVLAAINYLQDTDMTAFLPETVKPIVTSILWTLTAADVWQVTVRATRELTPEEQEAVSEWVSGQNSDGLGEGFEQQSWAETYYEEDYEEKWSMASFDWKTNECKLVLVEA